MDLLLLFHNILPDLCANLTLRRPPGSSLCKLVLNHASVFDLAGVVLIVKVWQNVDRARRRWTRR